MTWQAGHPGFVRLAWLLPLALTLVEVEQWNIVAFLQARFPGVAAVNAAHFRVTMFIGVLIGWLWTRAAMRARSARRAAFGILPFASIGVLDALLHAFATVYFRAYVPGTVMVLTVFAPASLLLARHAWRDGLVPRAYIVVLTVFVLLNFGAHIVIDHDVDVAYKLGAGERFGAALARLVGQ